MCEIGDTVARHVVMVEGLAELLRRIDFHRDGAVRRLLDQLGPGFDGWMHRVAWRHPMAEAKFDRLVLRDGRSGESNCGAAAAA